MKVTGVAFACGVLSRHQSGSACMILKHYLSFNTMLTTFPRMRAEVTGYTFSTRANANVMCGISALNVDDLKISLPRLTIETLFPFLLASMQHIGHPISQ